MSLDKIRTKILEALYAFLKNNPNHEVNISNISSNSGLAEALILREIPYLIDKGYISAVVSAGVGARYSAIKITHEGRDFVEGPSAFNKQIPAVEVNITIQNFFVNIRNEIEKNPNISEKEKKGLLDSINNLISHPVVSGVLSNQLIELIKTYGSKLTS